MTTEQITSTAEPIEGRPPWDDGKWTGTAWRVTLNYDGRTFETPFYMGEGHNRRVPETMEVVECLLSDACAAESARDEWDFFNEMGLTPSRQNKAVYDACVQTAIAMQKLLGNDFERFAYPDHEEEA